MFESLDAQTHGPTDGRSPARVPSYKLTLCAFSNMRNVLYIAMACQTYAKRGQGWAVGVLFDVRMA